MADSCTVLVENLPADASREDLSTYFAFHGHVEKVLLDGTTALITFESGASARSALLFDGGRFSSQTLAAESSYGNGQDDLFVPVSLFGGAPPGASPLLYHSCEGQPRDSARQVNLTARSGFGPQAGAQRHAARRPPEARRRLFLRPHSGKIPPRSGAQRMRALRSNVAIWQ
ncbi:hypothetical protein EMIHUDRAFT_258546 [Emiliania huxleyi CCMP1516]|uniref:RRM domain-containing protein n=2 Tax=Emiliania huxleyi TaxID=2903 RepID=A0A0D3I8N3_EMIH1|nr:hypothetical protein EMIHUDRAFT_258546 [Emiliania huxleyi CCMP1516]EOD07618.1 hypothetical protein EMIHUDRAFT_258546 [Emiliania huxleyi CCMP1516]|eukprot:XP_005760047.1 hypothetical protein EMIHUDRAFT_258546 [Emiliania huxleyi CCMP1516]